MRRAADEARGWLRRSCRPKRWRCRHVLIRPGAILHRCCLVAWAEWLSPTFEWRLAGLRTQGLMLVLATRLGISASTAKATHTVAGDPVWHAVADNGGDAFL